MYLSLTYGWERTEFQCDFLKIDFRGIKNKTGEQIKLSARLYISVLCDL